ncbi:hypothetical protein BV22DRAFT_596907 [Leucogyrophana mollusca]|uniref:Uncharacterized protein n=1 Tax=Leucogyrophana mollusca TaxID=85980 RepID=A0ACB8BDD5_9AGAM|nr:hypothetical protein BV22DRAFT_596907 [Leucogyrophana mollusca]
MLQVEKRHERWDRGRSLAKVATKHRCHLALLHSTSTFPSKPRRSEAASSLASTVTIFYPTTNPGFYHVPSPKPTTSSHLANRVSPPVPHSTMSSLAATVHPPPRQYGTSYQPCRML